MLNHVIQLIVGSFIFCLIAVPPLRALAFAIGLTDKPSSRKLHNGEVPLVGGLALFLGCVVGWIIFDRSALVLHFLVLAAPLVLVGVLDDLREVHPGVRVIVQIGVSVGMIYLCGIQIDSIGNIIGQGSVQLGPVAAPIFTIFCVIGVINAINMLDGCDGLAGSVSLATVVTLAAVAGVHGDIASTVIGVMLVGGLIAFLLYNTHVFGTHNRIFLGDAGSMFIGYALVWLFVSLSQGDDAVQLSPIAAGWMFGLPLVDVISVMVGRIRKGNSPFSAGRDHFHCYWILVTLYAQRLCCW